MVRVDSRPVLTVVLFAAAMALAAASGWPQAEGAGPPSAPVTLKILSFNVWVTASNVNDGYQKTLSAIDESGADIVGLQETGGRLATALALDLGWYAYQGSGSVAVLSRFPISETFPL